MRVGVITPLLSQLPLSAVLDKLKSIGFAITCGWIGLAVSSRTIGAIAGGDALRLRKALLLIPASAVLMEMMSLIMIALHTR
jgi:hypothetical protein